MTKRWTTKWPYVANALFQIVKNHGEWSYFLGFRWGHRPPLDAPLSCILFPFLSTRAVSLAMHRVTKMPIGERNLSTGFIQQRTPVRINICSVTQQPPGTKLNTIWYQRAIQTTRQSNSTRHVISKWSNQCRQPRASKPSHIVFSFFATDAFLYLTSRKAHHSGDNACVLASEIKRHKT